MAAKANILVIWGDDIGITNLSCYSEGVMGYRTPNIDRLAREGMKFTDAYGEQSCTAGRASFITGQSSFRTGLTKVGVPGATVGLKAEDPTIAELLRLAHRSHQHHLRGAGDRGAVPRDVQGLPAASESGQLHHRPGARENVGAGQGRVSRGLRAQADRAAPGRRGGHGRGGAEGGEAPRTAVVHGAAPWRPARKRSTSARSSAAAVTSTRKSPLTPQQS